MGMADNWTQVQGKDTQVEDIGAMERTAGRGNVKRHKEDRVVTMRQGCLKKHIEEERNLT